MYSDVVKHCSLCPQCAIVTPSGKENKPPLHPIPVSRPFQIIGVDMMNLPVTKSGNRHAVVFQDFLKKFLLVFPVPDQKVTHLLVEQVILLFRVPESLLSDRGTNLLFYLMKDLCSMLGKKKINTTAYHPQCDGIVECFNRTLKTMPHKYASTFGNQWDCYLFGVLFAYRNTPHDSTGEKLSYPLIGMDYRMPSAAALLPTSSRQLSDVADYKEDVALALSVAQHTAAKCIQQAQKRYKKQCNMITLPPQQIIT